MTRSSPTPYTAQVSASITTARLARGLTIEQLAERTGFVESTIRGWENQAVASLPKTGTLLPLASALAVSIDWLLRPVESGDQDEDGVFLVDMNAVSLQSQSLGDDDAANSLELVKRIDVHGTRIGRCWSEMRDMIEPALAARRRRIRKN